MASQRSENDATRLETSTTAFRDTPVNSPISFAALRANSASFNSLSSTSSPNTGLNGGGAGSSQLYPPRHWRTRSGPREVVVRSSTESTLPLSITGALRQYGARSPVQVISHTQSPITFMDASVRVDGNVKSASPHHNTNHNNSRSLRNAFAPAMDAAAPLVCMTSPLSSVSRGSSHRVEVSASAAAAAAATTAPHASLSLEERNMKAGVDGSSTMNSSHVNTFSESSRSHDLSKSDGRDSAISGLRINGFTTGPAPTGSGSPLTYGMVAAPQVVTANGGPFNTSGESSEVEAARANSGSISSSNINRKVGRGSGVVGTTRGSSAVNNSRDEGRPFGESETDLLNPSSLTGATTAGPEWPSSARLRCSPNILLSLPRTGGTATAVTTTATEPAWWDSTTSLLFLSASQHALYSDQGAYRPHIRTDSSSSSNGDVDPDPRVRQHHSGRHRSNNKRKMNEGNGEATPNYTTSACHRPSTGATSHQASLSTTNAFPTFMRKAGGGTGQTPASAGSSPPGGQAHFPLTAIETQAEAVVLSAQAPMAEWSDTPIEAEGDECSIVNASALNPFTKASYGRQMPPPHLREEGMRSEFLARDSDYGASLPSSPFDVRPSLASTDDAAVIFPVKNRRDTAGQQEPSRRPNSFVKDQLLSTSATQHKYNHDRIEKSNNGVENREAANSTTAITRTANMADPTSSHASQPRHVSPLTLHLRETSIKTAKQQQQRQHRYSSCSSPPRTPRSTHEAAIVKQLRVALNDARSVQGHLEELQAFLPRRTSTGTTASTTTGHGGAADTVEDAQRTVITSATPSCATAARGVHAPQNPKNDNNSSSGHLLTLMPGIPSSGFTIPDRNRCAYDAMTTTATRVFPFRRLHEVTEVSSTIKEERTEEGAQEEERAMTYTNVSHTEHPVLHVGGLYSPSLNAYRQQRLTRLTEHHLQSLWQNTSAAAKLVCGASLQRCVRAAMLEEAPCVREETLSSFMKTFAQLIGTPADTDTVEENEEAKGPVEGPLPTFQAFTVSQPAPSTSTLPVHHSSQAVISSLVTVPPSPQSSFVTREASSCSLSKSGHVTHLLEVINEEAASLTKQSEREESRAVSLTTFPRTSKHAAGEEDNFAWRMHSQSQQQQLQQQQKLHGVEDERGHGGGLHIHPSPLDFSAPRLTSTPATINPNTTTLAAATSSRSTAMDTASRAHSLHSSFPGWHSCWYYAYLEGTRSAARNPPPLPPFSTPPISQTGSANSCASLDPTISTSGTILLHGSSMGSVNAGAGCGLPVRNSLYDLLTLGNFIGRRGDVGDGCSSAGGGGGSFNSITGLNLLSGSSTGGSHWNGMSDCVKDAACTNSTANALSCSPSPPSPIHLATFGTANSSGMPATSNTAGGTAAASGGMHYHNGHQQCVQRLYTLPSTLQAQLRSPLAHDGPQRNGERAINDSTDGATRKNGSPNPNINSGTKTGRREEMSESGRHKQSVAAPPISLNEESIHSLDDAAAPTSPTPTATMSEETQATGATTTTKSTITPAKLKENGALGGHHSLHTRSTPPPPSLLIQLPQPHLSLVHCQQQQSSFGISSLPPRHSPAGASLSHAEISPGSNNNTAALLPALSRSPFPLPPPPPPSTATVPSAPGGGAGSNRSVSGGAGGFLLPPTHLAMPPSSIGEAWGMSEGSHQHSSSSNSNNNNNSGASSGGLYRPSSPTSTSVLNTAGSFSIASALNALSAQPVKAPFIKVQREEVAADAVPGLDSSASIKVARRAVAAAMGEDVLWMGNGTNSSGSSSRPSGSRERDIPPSQHSEAHLGSSDSGLALSGSLVDASATQRRDAKSSAGTVDKGHPQDNTEALQEDAMQGPKDFGSNGSGSGGGSATVTSVNAVSAGFADDTSLHHTSSFLISFPVMPLSPYGLRFVEEITALPMIHQSAESTVPELHGGGSTTTPTSSNATSFLPDLVMANRSRSVSQCSSVTPRGNVLGGAARASIEATTTTSVAPVVAAPSVEGIPSTNGLAELEMPSSYPPTSVTAGTSNSATPLAPVLVVSRQAAQHEHQEDTESDADVIGHTGLSVSKESNSLLVSSQQQPSTSTPYLSPHVRLRNRSANANSLSSNVGERDLAERTWPPSHAHRADLLTVQDNISSYLPLLLLSPSSIGRAAGSSVSLSPNPNSAHDALSSKPFLPHPRCIPPSTLSCHAASTISTSSSAGEMRLYASAGSDRQLRLFHGEVEEEGEEADTVVTRTSSRSPPAERDAHAEAAATSSTLQAQPGGDASTSVTSTLPDSSTHTLPPPHPPPLPEHTQEELFDASQSHDAPLVEPVSPEKRARTSEPAPLQPTELSTTPSYSSLMIFSGTTPSTSNIVVAPAATSANSTVVFTSAEGICEDTSRSSQARRPHSSASSSLFPLLPMPSSNSTFNQQDDEDDMTMIVRRSSSSSEEGEELEEDVVVDGSEDDLVHELSIDSGVSNDGVKRARAREVAHGKPQQQRQQGPVSYRASAPQACLFTEECYSSYRPRHLRCSDLRSRRQRHDFLDEVQRKEKEHVQQHSNRHENVNGCDRNDSAGGDAGCVVELNTNDPVGLSSLSQRGNNGGVANNTAASTDLLEHKASMAGHPNGITENAQASLLSGAAASSWETTPTRNTSEAQDNGGNGGSEEHLPESKPTAAAVVVGVANSPNLLIESDCGSCTVHDHTRDLVPISNSALGHPPLNHIPTPSLSSQSRHQSSPALQLSISSFNVSSSAPSLSTTSMQTTPSGTLTVSNAAHTGSNVLTTTGSTINSTISTATAWTMTTTITSTNTLGATTEAGFTESGTAKLFTARANNSSSVTATAAPLTPSSALAAATVSSLLDTTSATVTLSSASVSRVFDRANSSRGLSTSPTKPLSSTFPLLHPSHCLTAPHERQTTGDMESKTSFVETYEAGCGGGGGGGAGPLLLFDSTMNSSATPTAISHAQHINNTSASHTPTTVLGRLQPLPPLPPFQNYPFPLPRQSSYDHDFGDDEEDEDEYEDDFQQRAVHAAAVVAKTSEGKDLPRDTQTHQVDAVEEVDDDVADVLPQEEGRLKDARVKAVEATMLFPSDLLDNVSSRGVEKNNAGGAASSATLSREEVTRDARSLFMEATDTGETVAVEGHRENSEKYDKEMNRDGHQSPQTPRSSHPQPASVGIGNSTSGDMKTLKKGCECVSPSLDLIAPTPTGGEVAAIISKTTTSDIRESSNTTEVATTCYPHDPNGGDREDKDVVETVGMTERGARTHGPLLAESSSDNAEHMKKPTDDHHGGHITEKAETSTKTTIRLPLLSTPLSFNKSDAQRTSADALYLQLPRAAEDNTADADRSPLDRTLPHGVGNTTSVTASISEEREEEAEERSGESDRSSTTLVSGFTDCVMDNTLRQPLPATPPPPLVDNASDSTADISTTNLNSNTEVKTIEATPTAITIVDSHTCMHAEELKEGRKNGEVKIDFRGLMPHADDHNGSDLPHQCSEARDVKAGIEEQGSDREAAATEATATNMMAPVHHGIVTTQNRSSIEEMRQQLRTQENKEVGAQGNDDTVDAETVMVHDSLHNSDPFSLQPIADPLPRHPPFSHSASGSSTDVFSKENHRREFYERQEEEKVEGTQEASPAHTELAPPHWPLSLSSYYLTRCEDGLCDVAGSRVGWHATTSAFFPIPRSSTADAGVHTSGRSYSVIEQGMGSYGRPSRLYASVSALARRRALVRASYERAGSVSAAAEGIRTSISTSTSTTCRREDKDKASQSSPPPLSAVSTSTRTRVGRSGDTVTPQTALSRTSRSNGVDERHVGFSVASPSSLSPSVQRRPVRWSTTAATTPVSGGVVVVDKDARLLALMRDTVDSTLP